MPAPTGAPIYADILCGIDGTRTSYEAVRQAAELAGPAGQLTLVAVTAVLGAGTQRSAAMAPVRAERALERALKIANDAGVAARTEIDENAPVTEVLLQRGREHGLLALGAPSMARLAHVLIGGTATAAAHLLPVSLLVARRPSARVGFTDRLIVASDGEERSDELVAFAIRLARERGSTLTFVHAQHGASHRHPTRIGGQADRVRDAIGDGATVLVEPGRPYDVIMRAAAAGDASLVVMSSRRVGGVRSLGSVSERVVHDAPCSVLVVRPEDLA